MTGGTESLGTCKRAQRWHAVTKTTATSCTDDTVLIRDTSVHTEVYTTTDSWSNTSRSPSTGGLSDQVMMRLGGRFHSSSVPSTCDAMV